MILDALRVLLFGMLGIFVVMAIIFGVIVLLSRISARANKLVDTADEVVIPVDVNTDTAAVYLPVADGESIGEYAEEYVVDEIYGYEDGYEDNVEYVETVEVVEA